ncbi:unnamed protein product [Allacma fusca]|uniref:Nose resistant-to-fluoxetine protein N-terminal domain-containing protein n=1 Tax=Allacma fusca TaxID=39272 RepID=A0A8J2PAZ0_9HEXA|nr:unnamed protein product [Allacma fusca]
MILLKIRFILFITISTITPHLVFTLSQGLSTLETDLLKEYPKIHSEFYKSENSFFKDTSKFHRPLKVSQGTIISDIVLLKRSKKIEINNIFQNLTEKCAGQLRYVIDTEGGLPETWVLQMLDAWGKFPSGVLSGHTSALGDFQECMHIRGEHKSVEGPSYDVRGRYCFTYVLPGPKFPLSTSEEILTTSLDNLDPSIRESVSWELLLQYLFETSTPILLPRLGTCFPASCSMEEVQQFLTSYHHEVSQDLLSQIVIACYTDDKPQLAAGDWIMIIILAGLVLVCIAGTAVEFWCTDKLKQSLALRIVVAFSVSTNTKRWLNTKGGSENFSCLNGIRFLTMAWVLLSHVFLSATSMAWNGVDIKHIYKDWTAYPILNGTLAVDTFFVLSGFLVSYNLLKMLDKTNGRFNYFLFVVHRYLRLTPSVLIMLGILATILPYTGSGPSWTAVDMEKDACQSYWWRNILYISSLFQSGIGKCYGLTWYLDVDMQLFILSPLVIIPLWRWKKIGFGILGAVGILSIAIPLFIKAHFHEPPTSIASIPNEPVEYWGDLYTKTWVRFGAYTVGLALGYVMYLKGRQPNLFKKIPKLVVVVGWTFSTAFALAIIYGVMYYFDPKNLMETRDSAHAAIYGGLHRFVWGVCIAWVIFACVNGFGGWMNKILSLKIFIPLARLSFGMYLVQWHVLLHYYMSELHTSHFSRYSVVIEFFGILIICGIGAFVLLISVEAPFMQLTKMLLPTGTPQQKKPEKVKEKINAVSRGLNTTNGNV